MIVVGGIPNFSFYPTKCKYEWPFLRQHQCVEKDFFKKQYTQYQPDFEVAKANPKVHIIDLYSLFCLGDSCAMAKDGLLLFRDENHVNINGSRLIAKRIESQLN